METGLIGRKLGMTRIYTEDGDAVPVTVVELGPNTVLRKRTHERNGYTALQLGYGEIREKLVNRPEKGAFEKIKQPLKRTLREFRVDQASLDKYEEGQELTCDLFSEGQRVDVTATSKGRGFAGVIKRHNMAGFPATHGTHEYKRHGGSIGCRAKPGRIFPGKHMAGHMGNVRVTTQNVTVVKVMAEENMVLLLGSVPGPNRGMVIVRPAVKTKTPRSV